jgi:ATP-dependent Clp protease protease subunit
MTRNSPSLPKKQMLGLPEMDPSLGDQGIYLFFDDFNSSSARDLVEWILTKNLLPASKRPDHLTLVINSPGGDLNAAFAIIDVMRGSAIPVHTVGLGQISSCGVLTFMSGAKGHRVLTPNTSILSHQWSWGTGGKEHELFAVQREFELTRERMIDHYRRCTGMDEKTIKKVLLPPHDVWLDAKEAVKYGIADRVKEFV